MPRFNEVKMEYVARVREDAPALGTIRSGVAFQYRDDKGFLHGAGIPLFLISEAWERGCSMEDLADGFGKGLGTCGGDWSGIRDSSEPALDAMLERALNFLFPAK